MVAQAVFQDESGFFGEEPQSSAFRSERDGAGIQRRNGRHGGGTGTDQSGRHPGQYRGGARFCLPTTAGNIASGLIPIVRGGTGGSTPAAARQNLGITPQNIGAMPTTGGAFTGPVSFDGSTIGLRWTTANGTTFSVRPHTSGNLFQITAEGPNTGDIEYGMFNIEDNGDIWLENALSVNSGGTGAKDAAGAPAKPGHHARKHWCAAGVGRNHD